MEQEFRLYLSQRPELAKCHDLLNIRALARELIAAGIAKKNHVEAVVAMLRRFPFEKTVQRNKVFREKRMQVKDKMVILHFAKSKALLQELQKMIAETDYEKGDTLKIVVGSSAVTVVTDQHKKFDRFPVLSKVEDVSEISLMFTDSALDTKGILAMVTQELALNDIVVAEFMTASSELIFYVKDEYVLRACEIIKRLQRSV